jgi:6-phosphogluconolactonase
MKKILLPIIVCVLLLITSISSFSQPIRLFAGRYTDTGGKGLYLFDLNRESGTFKELSEAEAGPNPSYFCISKKKGLIYAANEVMEFNGVNGGGVTALKYDPEKGSIEKIKDLLVPYGGPCFISITPDESYLLLANYSSSSITVVRLDANEIPDSVTDKISFPENEGKVSHPHMISFGPSGKKVYLTDLGLDRIVIYDLDYKTGKLSQSGILNFPKGTGPRHFVFNNSGTKMYVICELNSTISVLDVDKDGGLKLVQTLTTLAEDFKGESNCADIHLGKNEQFLYGSNRGENTIVTYKIEADGKLELAGRTSCGGDWPRNFVIDPTGKYLLTANQKSGNIVLYKIDQKSGLPVTTSKEFKIDSPVCLKF